MRLILRDGIHDDTKALQAHINGKKVLWPEDHQDWDEGKDWFLVGRKYIYRITRVLITKGEGQ